MTPRLLELVRETSTAESVYAEKYEWLMRWALHFCNGDREMAEDLVQDTFVRMVSSWNSIRDINNPERFLYTYLKYGFLRLRAADRRQTIQSISVDDLDVLDRLLPESGTDLLEWQQDIQGVVEFLCWRKTTTKSASLLLFRFFHGLFPAEIMEVACLSRKAVDDGLATARQEARTGVKQHYSQGNEGARKQPPLSLPRTPHLVPSLAPTEEFMRQMMALIYSKKDGECLSPQALADRYDGRMKTSADCWLLSHIVSCPDCLDFVLKRHALPPRGTRPLEDILGIAPKVEGRRTKKKVAPVSAATRSMLAAQEKSRQARERRPQSIALIVDGQRVASRDVSSPLNTLAVDLRPGEVPELLEVWGDDFLLLSVPVLATPPTAAPLQQFELALNAGRSVALTIEFNASGMRLHVRYDDPQFAVATSALLVPQEDRTLHRPAPAHASENLRHGLAEWLRRPFRPWFKVSVAFACLGILCIPAYRYVRRPLPDAVLSQAIAVTKQQAAGVVTQRVHVSRHTATGDASYDTTLHRDLAHKLKPNHHKGAAVQPEIELDLSSAKIAWSDPLSPLSFSEWRKQQSDATNTIATSADDRLTLTSKVPSGLVREQTLTLDATTFHTVGRTVRFRDNEVIEIAELNYSVIPLANSDPAWFEPSDHLDAGTGALVQPRRAAALPGLPAASLTPGQLDVAELNVRLAMIELHADGQERLAIHRTRSGVLVDGLVATAERRREIESRLRLVPHAASSIQTFNDFDSSRSNRTPNFKSSEDIQTSVRGATGTAAIVADATDHVSPLDTLSPQRHLSAATLRAIHASLLDAAIELRHSAMAMRDLDGRFRRQELDADGKTLRLTLMRLYTSRMDAATARENAALQQLGASLPEAPARHDQPLWDAAMANAQLCFELISQQTENPRPAETILQDLATSAHVVERSLEAARPAP